MSGSGGRKRSSKWDSKEESRTSYENLRNSSWSGREDRSYNNEVGGGNRSRWSNLEPRRASRRDDLIDEEYGRTSKPIAWDRDDSYGPRVSPGLDDRRQRNRLHSPNKDWTRPRRSRSQSRSRSRSPVHLSRRESGTSYSRSRSRPSVTAQLCKEFVAARCRRGSQCNFLHETAGSHEDSWDERMKALPSRYSASNDSKEYPAGRLSGHSSFDASGKGSKDDIIRDREIDKRHGVASLERHNEQTRKAMEKPCRYFASGHCWNGTHCMFSHQVEDDGSPKRKLHFEKPLVDRNADSPEKTWDGPSWSDVNSHLTAAKSSRDVEENPWNDGKYSKPNCASSDTAVPVVEPSSLDHQSPADLVESGIDKTLMVEGNNAGDSSRHLPDQSMNNDWEGDMEMSPEWNQSAHINSSGYILGPGPSLTDLPLLPSVNSVVQTQVGTLSGHSSIIPSTQEMVSGEQLYKLTDFSVSLAQLLAQLLAQGQQLPQLYAAHSAKAVGDIANPESPVELHSVATIQGNLAVESGNKEKGTSEEVQVPKSKNLQTGAESEVGKESSGKKAKDSSKEKESKGREVENVDGDDEGEKKNKEAKVIRAFKFALVEFVKEALKPAWKEGQVSKDSYKNIVKKVVDKVTGTMQASSVPQTQEKIDQYLSASKPKLTKLVQAYVEKFQKGK